jgi:hypothetical protein
MAGLLSLAPGDAAAVDQVIGPRIDYLKSAMILSISLIVELDHTSGSCLKLVVGAN